MIRTLFVTFTLVTGCLLAPLSGSAAQTPPSTTPSPPPPTAPAPPPAAVYCGSFTCFWIRVGAYGNSPEARANNAMSVINKYLGGAACKVTTAPSGKNIRVLLNSEVVAVVTPDDAAAEKHKAPSTLATRWAKFLTEAFNATKSQPK